MVNLARINKYQYKCFKPIHELSEEVLAGSSRSKEELMADIAIGLDNVLRLKKALKRIKKELKKYGPHWFAELFAAGSRSEYIDRLKACIFDCRTYEAVLNSLSSVIEYNNNDELIRIHKEIVDIAVKINIQPNWKVYLTLGGLLSRKKRKEVENVHAK